MLSAFLYLNNLVLQIFKCPSVKWLSMKYNYLDKIPADIGRMAALEYLALTNNKLQNKSLPHTLTFCNKLKALMLDNNLLDALPGFLIKMSSLKTVHRHGNHNYFKSTFMWYHTDVNERILAVSGTNDFMPREPETLQFWAAKSVIGLKLNFFADPAIATVLKNYISDIYTMFNVCGYCNTAKLVTQPGTLNFQYNETCLTRISHKCRSVFLEWTSEKNCISNQSDISNVNSTIRRTNQLISCADKNVHVDLPISVIKNSTYSIHSIDEHTVAHL